MPGAITYLSESVPERQGVVIGILFMSLMTGTSLGTGVNGIISLYLDKQSIFDWGWRIPFWLGGSLGIISYQIRKQFDESGYFLALNQVRQRTSTPLVMLIRTHPKGLMCGLLVMALCGATASTYGIFMPGYLSTVLNFPPGEVARHTALAFLIISPACIVCGAITDRVNRKWVLFFVVLIAIGFSWPAFNYFANEGAELRKIMLICAVFNAISMGLLPPLLVSCFPTEVRYTGIAISYNVSVAIFSGLAPVISTLLIRESGLTGPAIYVTAVACFSLITLLIPWPDQPLLTNLRTKTDPE